MPKATDRAFPIILTCLYLPNISFLYCYTHTLLVFATSFCPYKIPVTTNAWPTNMVSSRVSLLATFLCSLFDSTSARPSTRNIILNEIRSSSANLSAYSPVLTDGNVPCHPSRKTQPSNNQNPQAPPPFPPQPEPSPT